MRCAGDILEPADSRIYVRSKKDCAREKRLNTISEVRENSQRQAGARKHDSRGERAPEPLGQVWRPQDWNSGQQRAGSKRGIHDKAEERIQQEKTIILQENEHCQREGRVMEKEFAYPAVVGCFRPEMSK